jgi:hypothetical protein
VIQYHHHDKGKPAARQGRKAYGPLKSRGSRATERRSLDALDNSPLQGVYKDASGASLMSPEMAEKVARAIEKHDAGLPLTDKEWVLLAFTVHSAGCSSCGGR